MLKSEKSSYYTTFMLVSSQFDCLRSDKTRSTDHSGIICYIHHRNILAKRSSQTFLMPPVKPEPCKLNKDNQGRAHAFVTNYLLRVPAVKGLLYTGGVGLTTSICYFPP